MSAPHHDAVYCHVPKEKADELAKAIERAFVEAGKLLMDDRTNPRFKDEFPLRIKAHAVRYPSHYVDADGQEIWDIVCRYFGWDKYATQEDRDEQQLENTGEVRDGVPAVSRSHQGGDVDSAGDGSHSVGACGVPGRPETASLG